MGIPRPPDKNFLPGDWHSRGAKKFYPAWGLTAAGSTMKRAKSRGDGRHEGRHLVDEGEAGDASQAGSTGPKPAQDWESCASLAALSSATQASPGRNTDTWGNNSYFAEPGFGGPVSPQQ